MSRMVGDPRTISPDEADSEVGGPNWHDRPDAPPCAESIPSLCSIEFTASSRDSEREPVVLGQRRPQMRGGPPSENQAQQSAH
jgi:hypothetical protein